MEYIQRGITGFADPGRRLSPLHANTFLAFIYTLSSDRFVLTWEDIDLTGKNYY
ncbi:hypothetical protein PA598K_05437 [Paenibacillus sp. 598K]|uniref:hypothetical protein n=1 Tax=Paenibacillus sp. 598K TaxID=1117987 RepID=UPI000FF9AFB9|nr:hypothetical protein [Paenibacillus sp. 598K]GBF76923.1 hypothetical protein PA598K_05437 [Paenibacillus sp. 598K]